MPIEQRLMHIAYDADPERCQGIDGQGQCRYKRVIGSTYCPRHSGQNNITQVEEQQARRYRLEIYQSRVNELADDNKITSLRDEIGILRMILETIINTCENSNTLLIHSARISDTVMKIEKLVVSCHNLEIKMGSLLDKGSVIQLAGIIVDVISEYVTGPDALDAISKEIFDKVLEFGVKKSVS